MSSQFIPLMDPGRGYVAYRDEIDVAVRKVLEAGSYILGPSVTSFERSFAQWCGIAEMIGVANGTDAIELALRTLEVGSGDVVFTVSHTAVATVAAIELAGATPVFIDVDPVTLTIDPQKLEDSIIRHARSAVTGSARAVIAVHIYGHPCDLQALQQICRRHELLLIEDCAQAHGARLNGQPVGSAGDAAAFSFYPTKNLSAFGDAGAVGFPSRELADRCRTLREYGWRERYISAVGGMNSRMDELQAAILNVRLHHLQDEIDTRRRIAACYGTQLAGIVETPATLPGADHAWHLYVARTARRQSLRDSLQKQRIGTGLHYPMPVHQQPAYANRIALGHGGLAVTELAAAEIVSLPMHPFLKEDELDAVVAGIKAWHEGRVA